MFLLSFGALRIIVAYVLNIGRFLGGRFLGGRFLGGGGGALVLQDTQRFLLCPLALDFFCLSIA